MAKNFPTILYKNNTQINIDAKGRMEYRNYYGFLHRIDGPALIEPDGTERYYRNNKKHREDGPAEMRKDGGVTYYQNGKAHREDGPAIMNGNIQGPRKNIKEYYLRGRLTTQDKIKEGK